MIRKCLLAIPAILLLTFGSGIANADPIITGQISINSGDPVTFTDSGGFATSDLGAATAIQFGALGGEVNAGTSTGTFGSIADGTLVQMKDFSFDPSVTNNPLWQFTIGTTTYSFDATVFGFSVSGTTIFGHTTETLTIVGLGTMSVTGFDDNNGTWVLTVSDNAALFNFESTTVPEPATIALLGLGLLGMGLSRRRKTAS